MGNIVPASCVNLMSGKKMLPELGPEMLCPIASTSSVPQVKTCIITYVCTSCICSHISGSGLKILEGESTVQFMLWFSREPVCLFIQFVFSDLFSNLPTVCHLQYIADATDDINNPPYFSQMRIQKPAKHLRWGCFEKVVNGF